MHVVTEIDRTVDAAEALKDEKYEFLGMLMTQSHESLRYTFLYWTWSLLAINYTENLVT